MAKVLLLLHSPLLGPYSWSLVAEELRARGHSAVVPDLWRSVESAASGWSVFGDELASALAQVPLEAPLHLVAHSGAGPLLPLLRESVSRPVASYVFVDAGVPKDGASFLDLLMLELPERAEEVRRALQAGERFPNWDETLLSSLIPHTDRVQRLVAELHPQSLAYFERPIPVPAGWPDAPCFYLQFSPAYHRAAGLARERGWRVERVGAGHFHMLVDPEAVATALLAMLD